MNRRSVALASTIVTIGLLAVVVWGIAAGIADGGPRDRVRTITEQLKCPVCQGESVADSPSPQATAIADKVRQQVAAGWSDAQIKQYYAGVYGDWILLDPPRKGTTLVMWTIPLLAITGAAIALVSRLEQSRRRRVLVVGAATLGLLSTCVLVFVGAREKTPRAASALGPATSAPPGATTTTVKDLSAVTNAEMEAVIAENPNVIGMRLALAKRYIAAGDFQKALVHTQAAINLPATDQEYEEALRLHGWVTANNGAPAAGAEYLKAALALSPTDRDAMWLLAVVELNGLGNVTAAQQALDELKKTDLTADERAHIATLERDIALAQKNGTVTTSTVAVTSSTTAP